MAHDMFKHVVMANPINSQYNDIPLSGSLSGTASSNTNSVMAIEKTPSLSPEIRSLPGAPPGIAGL
jgi:hypothetical protein